MAENVFYRLGENLAAWDNVCEYFPSSYERYNLSMGRLPKRKVYNVETGRVIPDSMLSSIAPIAAWEAGGSFALPCMKIRRQKNLMSSGIVT